MTPHRVSQLMATIAITGYSYEAIAAEPKAPNDVALRGQPLLSTQTSSDANTIGALRQSLASPSAAVAIAAGWERLIKSIPMVDQGTLIKPNEGDLSRFLGLLEGRLQTSLPPRWTSALQSMTFYNRYQCGFQMPDIIEDAKEVEDDQHRVFSVGYRCDDGDPVIEVENKLWRLSIANPSGCRDRPYLESKFSRIAEQLEADVCDFESTIEGLMSHLAIEIADDVAYLAIYSWPPTGYRLYAIDIETGSAKWTALVRESVVGGWTGSGRHSVELKLLASQVIVFGVSEASAYIEVYDRGSGKRLWVFNMDNRRRWDRSGGATVP